MSNKPKQDGEGISRATANAIRDDTADLLDLYDVPLSGELKSRIARLRQVKWLRLSAGVNGGDLRWLGEMTQLRGLSLAFADLKGADLGDLATMESLQWLNLRYARLTASEFQGLPRLANLQVLWLAGANVGDEFAAHLAELQLPALWCLDVTSSAVGDKGVQRLCSVYNLECFNLDGTKSVSGRSVPAIARMNKLRLLGIGGTGICPGFARNPDVEKLQRLLPACRVDYGD